MRTFQKIRYIALSFITLCLLISCGGESFEDNSSEVTSAPTTQSDNTLPQTSSPNIVESVDGQQLPEDEKVAASNNFYFSYDDSGSTASRDLTFFALNEQRTPATSWGRAYEYLTAESFGHFDESTHGPFKVSLGLYQSQEGELVYDKQENDTLYALGVNISGPEMTQDDRKNVVLTLLVDTSGSMDSNYASETRSDYRSLLDVTKYGLSNISSSLKSGDIINIVEFNSQTNVLLEGWEYSQSNLVSLNSTIDALNTSGSTNLNAGVVVAYQLANRYYDENKANRIVMLTDAYANTGEVDTTVIAENTLINGLEGIHFAGVGIGSSFNDDFLNELTDIGKGVYSAMITPTDAKRIFTKGFIRFIDHAVENIRFQLTYPNSWVHAASAAEEVSENKEDVQTVNFSYNSSQFFLEQFTANLEREGIDDENIILSITYDEDDTNQEVSINLPVAELLAKGEAEIKAAAAVYVLAGLVAKTISCQDVKESGLYSQEIEHEVFIKYKGAINQYCQ